MLSSIQNRPANVNFGAKLRSVNIISDKITGRSKSDAIRAGEILQQAVAKMDAPHLKDTAVDCTINNVPAASRDICTAGRSREIRIETDSPKIAFTLGTVYSPGTSNKAGYVQLMREAIATLVDKLKEEHTLSVRTNLQNARLAKLPKGK